MSWSQRFVPAIPLPDGRTLVTLRDAGNYIASLPESKQRLAHWRDATEALLLVGEHGGDPMLARIGMMRALHHGVPEPPRERARRRAKRYRIIG